jgi:hypothetical protein
MFVGLERRMIRTLRSGRSFATARLRPSSKTPACCAKRSAASAAPRPTRSSSGRKAMSLVWQRPSRPARRPPRPGCPRQWAEHRPAAWPWRFHVRTRAAGQTVGRCSLASSRRRRSRQRCGDCRCRGCGRQGPVPIEPPLDLDGPGRGNFCLLLMVLVFLLPLAAVSLSARVFCPGFPGVGGQWILMPMNPLAPVLALMYNRFGSSESRSYGGPDRPPADADRE